MRKFTSRFSVLFFAVLLSLTSLVPVNAKVASDKKYDGNNQVYVIDEIVTSTEDNPYHIKLEDGKVMYFRNKNDFNKYLNSRKSSKLGDMVILSGYTYDSVVLSEKYEGMLWIGYHSYTPDWSMADNYTLSAGKTWSANGSYEYKGFTVDTGFSYQTSVSISYPADPTRWSKLGAYGDFTFQYVKLVEKYYGMPTGNEYYTVIKITHNRYIKTVYK
ncbi:hypothetical protein [Defluviitalea saccharophila]|uniref:Uncharacterized protein n=1 Tax=Defluviitalea saccharophila TaxID=879970 RepID=A0ABZ2Y5D5_9FIRM